VRAILVTVGQFEVGEYVVVPGELVGNPLGDDGAATGTEDLCAVSADNDVGRLVHLSATELDMGHFFVTQHDPTQNFPDPTRPGACE